MEKIMKDTVKSSFWDFKGEQDFVDKWFLMRDPYPIILITVSYLLFVLKIGPDYMKKRPAFNLNKVLVLYNLGQVLISIYMTGLGTSLLWPQGLIFHNCTLGRKESIMLASGIHIYFLAKVSELLDTIFFVLRKKNNQISFLHVYHHTIMMWCTWLTLKYEPTYSTIFLGTLNSFVHVIMYAYYGLSTFPNLAKFLWWKKYITSLQLVQFSLVVLQAVMNYKLSGCPPSYMLLYTIVLNALLFMYLFGDFYVKSYRKNQKDKLDTMSTPKIERKVSKYVNDIQHHKLAEKVM